MIHWQIRHLILIKCASADEITILRDFGCDSILKILTLIFGSMFDDILCFTSAVQF